MSLITTNDGKIIFKKAESVMVVPYLNSSTYGDYVINNLENVYDISSVIGDSIVIEQSEGETATKNNEFTSSPLLEFTSGGKIGFSAQCIDFQNSVLRSLFGAMTINYFEGAAAFQSEFPSVFVLIRIRFKNRSLPDVYMPKVQLNSRLFIGQLKTRVSQGNIGGTALSQKVAIDYGTSNWLCAFSDPVAWTSRYCPFTPLVFVPRDKTPFFYVEKYSDTQDKYATIDFENGTIQHNVLVNEAAGEWAYVS